MHTVVSKVRSPASRQRQNNALPYNYSLIIYLMAYYRKFSCKVNAIASTIIFLSLRLYYPKVSVAIANTTNNTYNIFKHWQ
jgi:hypothetical protein